MPKAINCPTCQKAFKNQAALNRHQKTLHAEKIEFFVCPICFKTIRYLKNFSKHYTDAHKISQTNAKVTEKSLTPHYADSVSVIAGKVHVYILLAADKF